MDVSNDTLLRNSARDASASMRGYHYQIWRTIEAWLYLQADERIYIECGEDFDIVREGATEATQVKSSVRSISLNSTEVKEAIWNYWKLSDQGQLNVCLRFLTRARMAPERPPILQGKHGLDLWKNGGEGDEVATMAIARALSVFQCCPPSLKEFLRQSDAPTIRSVLLRRIVWSLDEPDSAQIRRNVRDLVCSLGESDPVEEDIVDRAVDGLFVHCWEVAIRAKPEERLLTFADLMRVYDQHTCKLVRLTKRLSQPAEIDAGLVKSMVDRVFDRVIDDVNARMQSASAALEHLQPAATALMKALSDAFNPVPRGGGEHARVSSQLKERIQQTAYSTYERIRELSPGDPVIRTDGKPTAWRINCVVKFALKSPVTEKMHGIELCLPAELLVMWGGLAFDFAHLTLRLQARPSHGCRLNWRLNIEPPADSLRSQSKFWHQAPALSGTYTYDYSAREMFNVSSQFIELVSQGWCPVAFIGDSYVSTEFQSFHLVPFECELEAGNEKRLPSATCLSKVEMLYRLSGELRCDFQFTDVLCNPALALHDTESMVRAAVSALAVYPDRRQDFFVPMGDGGQGITVKRGIDGVFRFCELRLERRIHR